MQNIYERAEHAVASGVPFSISFEDRTMRLGGRVVIDHGKYDGELGAEECGDMYGRLYELYELYKHSLPSERSERRRRMYFRALRADDLSDGDFLYGEPRELARFRLEFFVLAGVLNGTLVWPEGLGWFWQSEDDPDLVLLKKWVVADP